MRTHLRYRWLLVLAGLGIAAACGFSFPSPTTVTGQRVLSIATVPAELTPESLGPVLQTTSLVVDPTTDASVSFALRLCLVPAGSTGIVTSGGSRGRGLGGFVGATTQGNQETLANTSSVQPCPDDAGILATGPQALGNIEVNIPLNGIGMILGAPDGGLLPPIDAGPVNDGGAGVDGGEMDGGISSTPFVVDGGVSLVSLVGLDLVEEGLPVDLQIDLRTFKGDQTIYAVKDVPISLSLPPGDVPNHNPVLSGLTFDGMAWNEGTPLPVTLGACTPQPKGGIVNLGGSSTCTHTVVPVYNPDQSESFHVSLPDGGWMDTRETLSFYWFTTQGSFQRASTSQGLAGESSPDVGSNGVWEEPTGSPSGATFWVVVRDGRGGASWLSRTAAFQ